MLPDESHIKATHFGEASRGEQQRIDLSLSKRETNQLLLPLPFHCSVESHTAGTPEQLRQHSRAQVFRTCQADGIKGEGEENSTDHQPGQVASTVNPEVPFQNVSMGDLGIVLFLLLLIIMMVASKSIPSNSNPCCERN